MRQRGFTLIEIIVGIVTLGIALVVLSTLLFPQAPRSAEPLLQARASALGQMFINEIMSRSFDEQNKLNDSRCDATSGNCSVIGLDAGESYANRADFDDVDDYHRIHEAEPLDSLLPTGAASRFNGFAYEIFVSYANKEGQPSAGQSHFKLIQITITAPNQQSFDFSALRGNY